jgi:hypothetical protein
MVANIKKQLIPKNFKEMDISKSAGILDDYAVRKNVATREGTIEKVPTENNDITNKAYVDGLISAIFPVGLVLYIFSDTATTGFVLCAKQTIGNAGADLNGSTYYNLYAHIWDLMNRGVIASGYLNAAKGASALADYNAGKFIYLPDSRGIFIRGAGTSTTMANANGTAFTGSLGTHQNDKIQGHKHQLQSLDGIATVTAGGYLAGYNTGGSGAQLGSRSGSSFLPITDGTNGTPRTGLETNPANLALTAMIKY